MKIKILKVLYIILAFFFLGLGALGVVLPILPTTPFLWLASYFFVKGSDRFNRWFISTKLYKNHLEEFVTNRSMTLKRKLSILIPVSTILVITIIMLKNIYATLGILLVIAFKYYYFFAHIATTRPSDNKMVNKEVASKE